MLITMQKNSKNAKFSCMDELHAYSLPWLINSLSYLANGNPSPSIAPPWLPCRSPGVCQSTTLWAPKHPRSHPQTSLGGGYGEQEPAFALAKCNSRSNSTNDPVSLTYSKDSQQSALRTNGLFVRCDPYPVVLGPGQPL